MAETKLTDSEAQELLSQYSSDLRKLEFQLQQTKLAINQLQSDKRKPEKDSKGKKDKKEVLTVPEVVANQADTKIKIKPVRKVAGKTVIKKATDKPVNKKAAGKTEIKKAIEKPVKVKAAKKESTKKSSTVPKESGKKGRNPIVTPWDTVIFNGLGKLDAPKTSQDLLQSLINARDEKKIPEEGNTKLIQRLNASLTKLFKQNQIGKQKIEGKKAFLYYKIG
jgi:hypothetical protein